MSPRRYEDSLVPALNAAVELPPCSAAECRRRAASHGSLERYVSRGRGPCLDTTKAQGPCALTPALRTRPTEGDICSHGQDPLYIVGMSPRTGGWGSGREFVTDSALQRGGVVRHRHCYDFLPATSSGGSVSPRTRKPGQRLLLGKSWWQEPRILLTTHPPGAGVGDLPL